MREKGEKRNELDVVSFEFERVMTHYSKLMDIGLGRASCQFLNDKQKFYRLIFQMTLKTVGLDVSAEVHLLKKHLMRLMSSQKVQTAPIYHTNQAAKR